MMAANTICKIALIAALLASLLIAPGVASGHEEQQTSRHQSATGLADPKISVETNLVTLDVVVTDQDGRVLAGLKKENFRVLDEGKAQTIRHFETDEEPMSRCGETSQRRER